MIIVNWSIFILINHDHHMFIFINIRNEVLRTKHHYGRRTGRGWEVFPMEETLVEVDPIENFSFLMEGRSWGNCNKGQLYGSWYLWWSGEWYVLDVFGPTKSSNHVLFSCPVALLVWQAISIWLDRPMMYSSSARDHFVEFVDFERGKVKRKVDGLIWQATIWKIWKVRNELIFKDSSYNLDELMFVEVDSCPLSIILCGSVH